MDPNETFRLYKLAIAHGEEEDTYEHAEHLIAWIDRGGFRPKGFGPVAERQARYYAGARSGHSSGDREVLPGAAARARTYARAMAMPGLSKWNTFAGGTGAPSGSTSYSINFENRKYMIVPIRMKYVDRLRGYQLQVFPGEHYRWAHIGEGGVEVRAGGLFSRASSAAKAARLYAEHMGYPS